MRHFLRNTILVLGLTAALLGANRRAEAVFIVTNAAGNNPTLPLVVDPACAPVFGPLPSASGDFFQSRFVPRRGACPVFSPESGSYHGTSSTSPLDSVFWTILQDAIERPRYVWFPPDGVAVPAYSPTLLMTSRLAAFAEGGAPGQPPGPVVNLDRDVVPEPATILLNVLVIGSALLLASRIPRGKSVSPPKP